LYREVQNLSRDSDTIKWRGFQSSQYNPGLYPGHLAGLAESLRRELRPYPLLLLVSLEQRVWFNAALSSRLFLVPTVILSGFSTPIANMPQVVQWLTYLDPLRYFLVVVREVTLEGDGYALLINQYWPMAIIGVVSLALAGWLFRNRMY